MNGDDQGNKIENIERQEGKQPVKILVSGIFTIYEDGTIHFITEKEMKKDEKNINSDPVDDSIDRAIRGSSCGHNSNNT